MIGQGPTLSQAGLATGRLGRRLAWSRQAWLDTEGAFPYRASSSAAHAAGWHRLHTSILACTVPGPFVQIAFADECLQWWLLFPVVVRTRGSPKLCTEVFSLVMWCFGGFIGHMPAWALPTFCVRGGMPTEHLCIPKCVAGSSLAQGALTLLECVVGSWLAKRTNSTGVIALLVLGVFSPGLGPTLCISSLVGMIMLCQVLGAGRLGHRPAWSRPVRSGLEGASSHRTSLPATQADSWHSVLGRRVCLPGSPPCTVPNVIAQPVFADQLSCHVFAVVSSIVQGGVRTQESRKLCTSVLLW